MADLSPIEKEIWAGIRRPGTDNENEIKWYVDLQREDWYSFSGGYSGFQSDVADDMENFDDFVGHESDRALSVTEAESYADIIKRVFDEGNDSDTWFAFENHVTGESGSWDEYMNAFGSNNTFGSGTSQGGGSAAGIRVIESDGRTFDGVSVPAGTVEVFGNEVHFSEREPPSSAQPDAQFSNLEVSNDSPVTEQEVEITADVVNEGEYGTVQVNYREDDEIVETDAFTMDAGESASVMFERTYNIYDSVEVAINDLDPITISVVGGGSGGNEFHPI